MSEELVMSGNLMTKVRQLQGFLQDKIRVSCSVLIAGDMAISGLIFSIH